MATGEVAASTAWARGRLDGAAGSPRLLFGQMYEDAENLELRVFPAGGRVACIASAGCVAMQLARAHDVVAVDLNPVQLAYAERRIAGAPTERGTAERLMAWGRALAGVAGWRPDRLRTFVELDEPAQQLAYWHAHLDTRRFRLGFDTLLSARWLGLAYAPDFLALLPPRFGAVLRARMERCFALHPNRPNPFARALLLGELAAPAPVPAGRIALVCADAAAYFETQPARSFAAVTLSNILDGAGAAYRARLFAAVRHAAVPEAPVVLRSFAEPPHALAANHAERDRSMLWGAITVTPAGAL